MATIKKHYSKHLLLTILMLCGISVFAQRKETFLKDNWKFSRADNKENININFDDSSWETVSVPHDWAISGPFDKEIDKQVVAIVQNGETEANEKTGRSGSLPWIGSGWYRLRFKLDSQYERFWLNFDGAMAEPMVYVNGKLAGEYKYGYTPFFVDITPFVNKEGENILAVRLENLPESSRWYPGAGLYRPVKLIQTHDNAIEEWGINVVTEAIDTDNQSAELKLDVEFTKDVEMEDAPLSLIISSTDCPMLQDRIPVSSSHLSVKKTVKDVCFWSPENPQLYHLNLKLEKDNGVVLDEKTVTFGIRTVSVSEKNGFCLNGKTRKIKGVCLHHDLGMLGAAINKAALAHQIKLLKEMGCDAIRTSHNHPSQWQMDLCDSLGMMVMAESFDMWIYPKCKNGYARFFNEWWDRDLNNLVLSNRLHPSIVMWSIGNEIPEQGMKDGNAIARSLQNFIHDIDKTRPVTSGLDRIDNALSTGFAQVLDVPGMNYRTHKYVQAHEKLRHGFLLGSETASTVSSRGVYKFPVELRKNHAYDDGQCSGYDVECCSWSNLPEEDWVLQDDKDWVIGEFVWTGFDYLGEPTPYDGYWPSRSSYFGIFDLAGLPKDRYYLYRSKWSDKETIHLLPHWTWPGREGQVTPVYCYTNYPTAELFVNGKSQGKKSKIQTQETNFSKNTELLDRYRIRWNDVVYEPGELKVVVYDEDGNAKGEKILKTAGKPHHIELSVDRKTLTADNEDMAFITVSVVDKDGNLCPDADNLIQVKVEGTGAFKGICNGDATSLEPFTKPQMKTFKGMLSIGVISSYEPGNIHVTVSSKGLKKADVTIATH